MRAKCPHEVQTWPWVGWLVGWFFNLKMVHFPVGHLAALRRPCSPWRPILPTLGSLLVADPLQAVPSLTHLLQINSQKPSSTRPHWNVPCSMLPQGRTPWWTNPFQCLHERTKRMVSTVVSAGPSLLSTCNYLGFSLPLSSPPPTLSPRLFGTFNKDLFI